MITDLLNKDIDPEVYAEKTMKKPDMINHLLEGFMSKNETYRYNCFKVLNIVSREKPDLLYPHWDFFIKHLRSDNQYHKMSAVLIIANLTAIDTGKKFEKIFDEYYDGLKSEKTITPIYIVKSSGRIVNNKPKLQGKITKMLLNIEKIHPGKQVELVKAAVIESLSDFYENAEKKHEIIGFVKKQLDSSSPKTRKTAREFINKWGEIG